MTAKIRVRKLWLNILFDVPKNVKHSKIVDTLIRSIHRGDYRYPKNQGWRVVIEWRNKQDEPMRRGEFTSEMTASKTSSPGFDMAVLHYLKGHRNA